MPTDILMPRLADTLVEGTVARWLKAANDPVQVGEPIAEIETDKVTTELTATTSGVLSELLVAEGETVPIGTPLGRIYIQDELPASPMDRAIPATEEEAASSTSGKRASPLAARIAEAHGVDLSQIEASGSRITRADVEHHLAQPTLSRSASLSVQQAERSEGKDSDVPGTPSLATLAASGEVHPLTGLRRATAVRMSLVRQIPSGSAVVEADVTALVQFYQREKEVWLAREGFSLTYTPFFLYALAQSLRKWPAMRVTFRNGQAEPRDDVHVGVAVALEDGLIVPVIRAADQQDIFTLARSQVDVVTRARSHRLRPDEVTGGVATLTNVGSMGGLLAFPMLNENQATILGVGAVTSRAVADSDGLHYRSCVYLSLTFDRRLLDDLQAERFLRDVARGVAHLPPGM